MSEIIRVICPEHEQEEIVEVQADGEISWCSRVAGRPSCGGLCLSPAMNPVPLESLDGGETRDGNDEEEATSQN